MKKNIEELRWIRVFTPDHIPHYLIEQVGHRDYSVEEFFKYHQLNCLIQSEKGVTLNPFNHLYVLADKKNEVKGVLWFNVDPLAKDILVQTYSVDKEYWMKGQAVKKLADHIKQIRNKAKLNKIYWITNYPKHSMRYGFKPSKSVLMEYDPDKESKNGKNTNGRSEPRRECGSTDSRTEKLPDKCDGGLGSARTADGPTAVPTDVSKVVC